MVFKGENFHHAAFVYLHWVFYCVKHSSLITWAGRGNTRGRNTTIIERGGWEEGETHGLLYGVIEIIDIRIGGGRARAKRGEVTIGKDGVSEVKGNHM